MEAATFLVCGFHQGRGLEFQHFKPEERELEHAAYVNQSVDFVMLSTKNAQIAKRMVRRCLGTGLYAQSEKSRYILFTTGQISSGGFRGNRADSYASDRIGDRTFVVLRASNYCGESKKSKRV